MKKLITLLLITFSLTVFGQKDFELIPYCNNDTSQIFLQWFNTSSGVDNRWIDDGGAVIVPTGITEPGYCGCSGPNYYMGQCLVIDTVLVAIIDTCTQDTILATIDGLRLWDEYLSGVKPANDLPVYLTNLLPIGCDIDTFTNGVMSKGSKDSLIFVSTLGAYNNGMTAGIITNNNSATIATLNNNFTSISVDELSVVSIPISLESIECFQNINIDSVKFTFYDVTTDELLIDSSNAPILFVTLKDSAVMFFDVNTGEPIAFLNGEDTTVSVVVSSNNYNFETGLSLPIYNNTEYNLLIGLRDSNTLSFDKIGVEVYINNQLTPINIGINPLTGEIVRYNVADTVTQVTYAQIKNLITEDSLNYPAYYLITDTRTTWKYQYTDTDGDGSSNDEEVGQGIIEPLLVKTLDTRTIDETSVKSLFFPKDIIYWSPYVLNTSDYPDNATGVIYHRTDTERRISMNCDWRNIQQYRWNDGNGVYNVARKTEAPDTSDRELHYMITPYAKDVVVQRRGTPDNTSIYDNSNIVIKKAGTFFTYATTVSGTNELTYFNAYPLYDAVDYWAKEGDLIIHPSLPSNTTIDSVVNETIYVSANATASSTSSTLITTDFANVAVNYFTSATNLTVENQFYDNRIHILLQSTFNDMYLNDGLSVSLCEFDEYSHNDFNEIVYTNGTIFTKNAGKDLFGVVITDTLRHHNFLSDITNDTINPTEVMQSVSSSSTLFGEISGELEPITFRDYSSFTVDLTDSTELTPLIQLNSISKLDGGESSVKIKAASSVPTVEISAKVTDTIGAPGAYLTFDVNAISIGNTTLSEQYSFPLASSLKQGDILKLQSANLLGWESVAIPFTPSGESDSTYNIGTITYDATYMYIKIDDSPHVWNRFAKTAW